MNIATIPVINAKSKVRQPSVLVVIEGNATDDGAFVALVDADLGFKRPFTASSNIRGLDPSNRGIGTTTPHIGVIRCRKVQLQISCIQHNITLGTIGYI